MWLSDSSLRPLPKRGVKVPERLVAHDIYIIYITFGPWFWVSFKFEIEMETQELMIWQLMDAEPDFELDPIQVHEYTVDIAKSFFFVSLVKITGLPLSAFPHGVCDTMWFWSWFSTREGNYATVSHLYLPRSCEASSGLGFCRFKEV